MPRSVCVVGGGIAGAGTAYALPEDVEVSVLESRSVGGRLASRRREGCVYDHGADHLRLADDDRAELVKAVVGDTLIEIPEPIHQFEADGTITDRPDEFTRWSGENGIDGIVWAVLEAAGADVEEGATVTGLACDDGEWVVSTGRDSRRFDAIVLATPAAATAVLLEAANWDAPVRRRLADVAADVPHQPVDVVALHYPFELDVSYYGLVSVERASDVVWLGRQECKPGHVPDGESLLTVQLGTLWSAANAGARPQETALEVAHRVAPLVGDDRLREPDWWDHHRWGRGLPSGGPEASLCDRTLEYDLAVAGDWVAGVGQAHAALDSGLAAGRKLAEQFGLEPVV
ncbi:NAD(P)/FAD-dependent oxidoreductase [Halorhabdus amylolytica]|uniref:NAD(P)/FAD-dependent oxidoreductase n=1 Tax=Halorhabdus amylolytica TaxID=2559573 RepID=UPI00145C0051|nr:FAD-dependent oxidoreductase [Halorhabdus amylolytica]